ncbi:hypothetical protein A0J61_04359 [Choanephora cucurbitarum]|uniref:Sialate O-acetylesterase domain-containing protein n=1 Tax=Choanephora cucurbitarum TaxID=101091 RepID=A0A1C7NEQ6_9FUNG|nr:hypothetical protein A0J61_04359 [Choanephora cucurbitarum]
MYDFENIAPYQVLKCKRGEDHLSVQKQGHNLQQFKVGGPYYYGNDQTKPFYVGEIWVLAGEGNMQGLGYRTEPFTMKTLQQPVNHDKAFLYDSSEHWTFDGFTGKFSEALKFRGASLAPAFVNKFGEKHNGVPIGLIPCAQENSSLIDWEAVCEDPDMSLYNAMLDKTKKAGGDITGVLWYQGESDALDSTRAENYGESFQNWMSRLRQDLDQPELPIVFVQLGSHQFVSPEVKENWKKIQAAQFEMFGQSSYTAGVASVDAGLDSSCNLSASGLSLVGRRLALAADKAMKGKGASATPLPSYAFRQKFSQYYGLEHEEVMSVVINFKFLNSPWKLEPGQPVVGFSYDKSEIPILKAFVEDPKTGSVRLYLPEVVDGPLTINYGMQPGLANLINKDEEALPVFRDFQV